MRVVTHPVQDEGGMLFGFEDFRGQLHARRFR